LLEFFSLLSFLNFLVFSSFSHVSTLSRWEPEEKAAVVAREQSLQAAWVQLDTEFAAKQTLVTALVGRERAREAGMLLVSRHGKLSAELQTWVAAQNTALAAWVVPSHVHEMDVALRLLAAALAECRRIVGGSVHSLALLTADVAATKFVVLRLIF
jgi:hypothetical protein